MYAAFRRAKGKLFAAVMAYGIRGEDLSDELDDVTAMCFSFMKSQIKRDAEKYEAVAAKNAENGKKGGRPKRAGGGKKTKIRKPGESEKSEGFSKNPKKPIMIMIKIMIMIMTMTMTQTMIMKKSRRKIRAADGLRSFGESIRKTECCQGKKGL